MIKKIILVFKSHFDIGFTDLAENVIQDYGSGMLRQVIETCRATENMGALRYVWTMPAWPLRYILDHCEPELKPELERLIQNGQIVWHALPFTSHTDCCAPEEYVRALQYARELSEQFDKPYPIAGKMTDVPGHGMMLPELLSRTGIRFLHLGCNEFATPPDVPRLFFWESPQGGRVLTMYSKGGYGTSLLPPEDWPYQVWMALMHTHDNCGPQSAEIITGLAEKARRAYPDAEIVCGTLDDFCSELEQYDLSAVPVINKDLADTWIHGIGSYPKEVSVLRENRKKARALHRTYASRVLQNQPPLPQWNELWDEYFEHTALFEEHTWGADVKTWLGKDRIYDKEDFIKARSTEPYQFMERSWKEQSARMRKASDVLESVSELLPVPAAPEESLCEIIYSGNNSEIIAETDRYQMRFDSANGCITSVFDKNINAEVMKSRSGKGVFSYRYERAGIEDITEFLRTYGYRFTDWGILDYGRSNYPECDHLTFAPIFDRYEALPDRIRFHFHTEESAEKYGDCRSLTLTVCFPKGQGISVELELHDKQASPFIEAGSFIIPLAEESRYLISRPCAEVDPRTQIVHCANHAFYCLEDKAAAIGRNSRVTVFPKDTPLMSIGSSGLYEYNAEFPENREPELRFNLFNNMWGTNFPQWIEGDFRYRFTIYTSGPDSSGFPVSQSHSSIPGIPDDLEVVDSKTEKDTLYLMLRDHGGETAQKTIKAPGFCLCETDFWQRPLGKGVNDELTFTLRPNGLHCIAFSRNERIG